MCKLSFCLITMIILVGCASGHYASTDKGTLEGKLVVEWVEPNYFIFRPDPIKPLKFTRASGEIIQPEVFYTDGGSIPRWFWALKNYSPWGYAPAFIIHDFLFYAHYCDLPPAKTHTVASAARVLSEVQKTMMESPTFDYGDEVTVYRVYLAVQSPWAVDAWEDNPCERVPPEAIAKRTPDATFTIEFPQK